MMLQQTGAVYPLGIIIESTADGARFIPNQDHPAPAQAGDFVVIHNKTGENHIRFRGVITEASADLATFQVVDQKETGRWPAETDPLGYLNPVYRAQEQDAMLLAALARGNPEIPYIPDGRHLATHRQMELMLKLAEEHRDVAGAEISTGILTPQPPPDQVPYGNINLN